MVATTILQDNKFHPVCLVKRAFNAFSALPTGPEALQQRQQTSPAPMTKAEQVVQSHTGGTSNKSKPNQGC